MLRQEFEEKDIEEILKRAINLDRLRADEDHDALTRSAAELGVSPEALEAAKTQWLKEKTTKAEMAEFLRERRATFNTHLAVYSIVNLCLFLLNIATKINQNEPELWFVYPALAWGIGLAIHAFVTFGRPSGFNEEFAAWRKQRSEDAKALPQ